jgi:flavin-dependent dehydrogenase
VRGRQRGGRPIIVNAPIVIGADGRNSIVAKTVRAEVYHERPILQGGYYAYWSGLPTDGVFDIHIGAGVGFAAAETHDGLTMVVGGWPYALYQNKKHDHEASYLRLFDHAPEFRERIRAARCESKIFGGGTPNFFRRPYGSGWALVGDAGYIKDPLTAQGIADAFRDAELVADAIDNWQSGASSFADAMSTYQSTRDAVSLPMFEFTCQLAMFEPPPETQALFAAMVGNQEATDAFVRMNAGTLSPAEFFAPEHVGAIMAANRASA